MATVKYDAMAKGGTYTNRDGDEKTRWIKCGVVFEGTNGGLSLKLEAMPVPFDGWISFFEPKPRDEKPAAKPAAMSRQGAWEDDLP